jgi:hypothetical protein
MTNARTFLLAALLLLTCTGCGSSLHSAIGVANALGTVASTAGARVNDDFAKADRACLWQPSGQPSIAPLDAQQACMTSVRASYGPALKAYDAFLLVWTPFAFAVRVAEANDVLGRAPDLDSFAALLPDLIRTADAFAFQYRALASPALPTSPIAPKGSP